MEGDHHEDKASFLSPWSCWNKVSPFLVSPLLCSGRRQRGQAAGGDAAGGGPQDLLPGGLVGIPGKGHHDLCRWRRHEGRMQCKSSYDQGGFKLPSFFSFLSHLAVPRVLVLPFLCLQ